MTIKLAIYSAIYILFAFLTDGDGGVIIYSLYFWWISNFGYSHFLFVELRGTLLRSSHIP